MLDKDKQVVLPVQTLSRTVVTISLAPRELKHIVVVLGLRDKLSHQVLGLLLLSCNLEEE